jgi:hypothetical protein
MTETEARLTRIATTLDGLRDQWERQCTRLLWRLGLGFAWLTVLITTMAIVKR